MNQIAFESLTYGISKVRGQQFNNKKFKRYVVVDSTFVPIYPKFPYSYDVGVLALRSLQKYNKTFLVFSAANRTTKYAVRSYKSETSKGFFMIHRKSTSTIVASAVAIPIVSSSA